MSKLYIIVIDFGLYDETKEPEWLHTVGVDMDYKTAEMLAIEHLVDALEVSEEDIEIYNVWYHSVEKVDGFNVTVAEEGE